MRISLFNKYSSS